MLNGSGFPVKNFEWQLESYDRLEGDKGWAYYGTQGSDPRKSDTLTKLIKRDTNNWPRLENLRCGTVLISTDALTLRNQPAERYVPTDYGPRTCFRVLGGDRYFYRDQTRSRSAGWVAVEKIDCP